MPMKRFFGYLPFLFLLFLSCKPRLQVTTGQYVLYPVKDSAYDRKIEAMIVPYRSGMEMEMNAVIGVSDVNMEREKGKPETLLGNFVADLVLQTARQRTSQPVDFCLLNFGGLRSNIASGDITRRAVFELMPFENELVVLTLPAPAFRKMLTYLALAGGQPVAGFRLEVQDKQPLHIYIGTDEIFADSRPFYTVVTSDYLANGGDNMSFFAEATATEMLNYKLRDAIIDYIIQQNKEGKHIHPELDGRVKILD